MGDGDLKRIEGDLVSLRPADESDLPGVAGVMGDPGVVAWWGPFGAVELAKTLGDPTTHPMIVEHRGEVVGYIQYDEVEDPMYRHASIDIAIAQAHQGKGLGTDAVRALVRYLLDEVGHHRVTIDPALANERAIRSYERVGFQRVGVMRQYEQGVDGTWHDGLLMDLLASDRSGASET